MTTLLTSDQYKQTMTPKMVDVTESAKPAADIWTYVGQLAKLDIVVQYVYDKHLVEVVYRNQTNTFDHVLLPTEDKNIFIVLIVDLNLNKIIGHYPLDLNKEYGTK